jgi:hypothetical protein
VNLFGVGMAGDIHAYGHAHSVAGSDGDYVAKTRHVDYPGFVRMGIVYYIPNYPHPGEIGIIPISPKA